MSTYLYNLRDSSLLNQHSFLNAVISPQKLHVETNVLICHTVILVNSTTSSICLRGAKVELVNVVIVA